MDRFRMASGLMVVIVLLCGAGFSTGEVLADESVFFSQGQSVYVPVYSHIYSGDREQPFYLAATLSVRNTDLKHLITLTAVDYYDSEGSFLKHYLEKALPLNPMATKRYVVPESDKSGGSGAKFIVTWQSDQPVAEPLIESVMISTKTQQGISFTSRGRVLEAISP